MGRFNSSKVDEWLKTEKLELLNCWARDYTLSDICKKIGVSPTTFLNWRAKYPEIDEAVKSGKEIVDYRVENALLKVALGYTTTETKTIISPPDRDGNRKIRVEKTEKEIPPNPTAIMCWLNNRKPENWKRNRDMFRTEDKDNNIVVNIIRKAADTDESGESWAAFVDKDKKKEATKKSQRAEFEGKNKEEEDLDYWPEDWSDE